MTESYDDYKREYDQITSRVRSFLSSAKSITTLRECERLLTRARRCADSMTSLAEIEGDYLRMTECKSRNEKEIQPLSEEVSRAMKDKTNSDLMGGGVGNIGHVGNNAQNSNHGMRRNWSGGDVEMNRAELFAGGGAGAGAGGTYRPPTFDENEAQVLASQSESLLLESQALCSETEQIGNETLHAMGRQRDQLFHASERIQLARQYAERASVLLKDMGRKALRNKIFLYTVIGILLLANFVVIVAIVKRKKMVY
mmetsp:Transcript_13702/g.19585  ORF Transcript_13702/g.19585 Transcript_13702/m.19585 type:complete len:255 (-) Transcript_13702:66-830(-)|eukprot:CAMPEP_0184869592 /NCGR_PEP_ID=MMETSP0580-20130426/34640_1 /TAXON_ID=1118495 /ORGANISM="Dactyliosolen fragilissimus" /LENGTH=254 /DNA_ID=CAMNT_0027371171 /DNA_START=20 /DNA_END=784 /DNA_ORIENTATION=-